MTDYAEVLSRLYALANQGRKLGLERMEAAAARLGHPERAFEVVHVAGTNGKGTVASFVAAMAQAGGKRTGLYTSPHLVRFAERIQVDGQPVAPEVLGPLLERVMDEAPELTFFEVATLAAFLAFRDAGVELAVLEVGLGGRLDATNIVPPPRVAAITRIAFDHMDELGGTLTEIAREKAGIIKAGSAVVVGKLHPDARAVVEARVAEVGARLLPLGPPEPIPGISLAYPRTAMLGTNLAVAVTIARELELTLDAQCDGIEASHWPGRNELLHRNRTDLTLLDCAHNPDGALAFSHVVDNLISQQFDGRRDQVALVFGALTSKNWRAMLDRLAHTARHLYLTAPPTPRAVPPETLAAAFKGTIVPDVGEALRRAREQVGPRGLVVVTGSCFTVGAARAELLGEAPDPVVEL